MTKQQKEWAQYLLLQYMEEKASEQQRKELSRLLHEESNDADWEALMEELFAIEPVAGKDEKRWQPLLDELVEKNAEWFVPVVKRISTWRKLAVAASVLLVIGTGAYFLLTRTGEPTETVSAKMDIPAPQSNRAMVTLANGEKIYLDSAVNGQLAMQGNIKIVKLANGQIIYETATGAVMKEMQYNTLFNPRGSKVIDMTLADGSKVWLNAGSSVTYPVAFIGNERKVEITGEAYFEVVHDAAKPFSVSKNDMQVIVLGTHFNVNAYDDEEQMKVTLLEGSVNVTALKTQQSTLLKPGEQAQLGSNNLLHTTSNTDLEQIMSWKNGRFLFDGADIKTIMRQVSRWYNVDIVYKASIDEEFVADISRDVPVSELLNLLQLTKGVHFIIDKNKITVMK